MRRHELRKMQEYVHTKECLMAFLSRELSDALAQPCGRCGNCSTPKLPDHVLDARLTLEAVKFLRGDYQAIAPRVQWPYALEPEGKRAIPPELQNLPGRSLCIYGDAGWGRLVARGKYQEHHFSDELVAASAQMIMHDWKPEPFPKYLAAVPSLRENKLVRDFASRLAQALQIPSAEVVRKIKETKPQKEMANSAQQAANLFDAFAVVGKIPEGPCLLVDDIFDSRWTLTVIGYLLAKAGGGPVYPFTLAKASDRRKLG